MLYCMFVVLLITVAAGAAQAQNCIADLPGGRIVETASYRLAYRTQPPKIAIGRHFTMEVVVCAKAGSAAVEALGVDAFMPEHRHGMNYQPAAQAQGGGRYRIEGLMLHMPGRWDLYFDVQAGGRRERLTDANVLR